MELGSISTNTFPEPLCKACATEAGLLSASDSARSSTPTKWISYQHVPFSSTSLSGNLDREDSDAFGVSRLAQMLIKRGKRKAKAHG